MASKFVTSEGTIDWDALSAKMAELQVANQNIISPTQTNLPAARTVSTEVPAQPRRSMNTPGFGGGTVTGTPLEINRLQEALRQGKTITMGGSGLSSAIAWDPGLYGLGRGILQYGTTSKQLKTADQLIQVLEANGIGNAEELVGGMLGSFGKQPQKLAALSAGVQDYLTQKQSFQQQAANYQAGTDIMAAAAETSNKALGNVQTALTAKMNELSGMWDTAIGKADEFVDAAQERTKTVLSNLDRTFADLNKDMSSAKAHAMQVALQSTLGGIDEDLKVTARRFGKDSPEYAQKWENKRMVLAGTQSKIHDTYAQLSNDMSTKYLTAYAATASQTAMFENYNEQAALDIYKAAAAADQQYTLNYASQMAGIEQLKMGNQTALAEWISATPVFSLSLSSIISSIMDMST